MKYTLDRLNAPTGQHINSIFSLLLHTIPPLHRGHRRQSFVAEDLNELVELRARQRTFHGAYNRTALGSLGYGLTIIRLFDQAYHLSESQVTFCTILFYGVCGCVEHHPRLLLEVSSYFMIL